MVAAETCQAAAVVNPFRFMSQLSLDVADGTDFGTNATFDATSVVNMKLLVADEPSQKGSPKQATLDTRPPSGD